ncbi:MAG: DUF2207 family protein [Methanobacterium sp.]
MDPVFYYYLTFFALGLSFYFCFLIYQFRFLKLPFDSGNIVYSYPPVMVNAIGGSLWSKEVGDVDINGFIATIFDLVGRGYLKVHYSGDEIIGLAIVSRKLNLEPFESYILHYLKIIAKHHNLVKIQSLEMIPEKSHADSKFFKNILKIINSERIKERTFKTSQNMFYHWKEHVFNEYYTNSDKLFTIENSKINRFFAVICLLVAGIIFILATNDSSPLTVYPFYSSIFLGVISLLFLILYPHTGIKWTPKGKQYFLELMKFKKYIKNPISVKKNPPVSYTEINRLLTYGIALGVPEEAFESLSLLENVDLENNSTCLFYQNGGYDLLKCIFIYSTYEFEGEDPRTFAKLLDEMGIT